MPRMFPAAATPGESLRHGPSGVTVKLLQVDGQYCRVRLPNGQVGFYPMTELEYGFNAGDIGSAQGAPMDPAASSSVRSGLVNSKVAQILSDVLHKLITPEQAAPKLVAEHGRDAFRKAHPVMGFLAEGSTIHEADPLGPGGVLIHKASGRPVTIMMTVPERGLILCKHANGELEICKADELLTGDGQALLKAEGGGTLQKRRAIRKGDHVRTRRGDRGTVIDSLSASSVVHIDGTDWENGLKNFPNDDLTIL